MGAKMIYGGNTFGVVALGGSSEGVLIVTDVVTFLGAFKIQ